MFNVFNYTRFNISISHNDFGIATSTGDYSVNPIPLVKNVNVADNSKGNLGMGELLAKGKHAAKVWAINALINSPPASNLCR